MRKLAIPSIVGREKEIYEKCAQDFSKEEGYTKIALSYLKQVEEYSKNYLSYVPYNIDKFTHIDIKDDDKKIIEKVYTQKFAPKDSIGRKYYNVIKANANGRCPICGGGKVKNLDHFLPKSEYPLLCVTPINLIPTCRDCNMDKNSQFDVDYYNIPFHPYLEEMKEEWLECEVTFYPDFTYCIKYKNAYDQKNDLNMWKKYEKHMKIYDLQETFQSKALEEVDNIKGMYKKELIEGSVTQVELSLNEVKKSAESIDINSWKSALYRELERKVDEFCIWLRR